MSVISTLPRWASVPLQRLADREEIKGMQKAPMDQDSFNQFAETAAGIINITGMDEVEGQDLAMGQPGVVSPQEGVTVRFEGDPTSANGEVKAVLDVTDQGGAVYVKSSARGFDAIAVQREGNQVIAQGGVVEQTPFGISGYIVAGQVG
ncbi:MAG: hypothetical protein KC800_20680 [Candidatus Eremiobacteraeota bacterium]|nr:hypothetical protein [Candidatus Eremiobacteraeota bacterium]